MKHGMALAAVIAAATLSARAAEGPAPAVLSVGRVQAVSSVPEALVSKLRPELRVVEAMQWRSEVFPSTTPLPNSLNDLPDVVSALVGFYDNDIPYLCQKGVIEPIDSVFAELGLDPKEIIPPNIYEAVAWDGKVWALPYRVESYVLRYRKDIMEKVGVEPAFGNWDEIFAAAEKISKGANAEKQVSGFLAANMTEEQIGCCLMGVAMDVPADAGTSFLTLVVQYQMRKVFWPDDFKWNSPEEEVGIKYEMFRTLTLSPRIGIATFPAVLMAGSGATIRPVGFMECFAVRKNSEEKTKAAREFIKLLLTKEAQIALVEATRVDKVRNPDLAFRHVPVFKHVVDSPEFAEIASSVPGYRVLLDTCMKARFAPADPARFEPQRKAIIQRFSELPALLAETGSRLMGFVRLMEPIQVGAQPAAPAASDVSRY